MTLNCTAEVVDRLINSPNVSWVGPSGSAVSTQGNANLRADSLTAQLIFSQLTANNSGRYTCQVMVSSDIQVTRHIDINVAG